MFGLSGSSAPTPSFASNPATTSGQSGSSLFGTPATSAPQTSNLFGGAAQQPASSAPSLGGLFSRVTPANTSQQTSTVGTAAPSLFSNPGASTTQAQPASTLPSLFSGGLGASTNQPQQPATGASNLFANLAGSTNPQPNNPGQQQGQGQDAAGLGQSTNVSGKNAHFDQLLERGKKRANQVNGTSQFGDLPTLQLGLGDIARKVRNLGTGGPSASQASQSDDSRAYVEVHDLRGDEY
jgi:nuclear pore complex protein Nup93